MAEATTGSIAEPTAGTETPRRRPFLFPKSARIVARRRFEALYASPSKRSGRYLVLWSAPSETDESRLGVTAAKRTFHDAHQRNRAKRLVRESFRRLRPSFEGGPWDLVVVARRRILDAKEPEVRADLSRLCRAAGILPDGPDPNPGKPAALGASGPVSVPDARPENAP